MSANNAMVTEETARNFLQNDNAKFYVAVVASICLWAIVCVWGLGRLRRKTHSGKVVEIFLKHVSEGKAHITTTSGSKLHLYADCKSLEPVALSRQKEWTLCAHCAHQEEKKAYDAADVLIEMLQDGA